LYKKTNSRCTFSTYFFFFENRTVYDNVKKYGRSTRGRYDKMQSKNDVISLQHN